MKMSQMFPSNWLAKEDLGSPVRTTIKSVSQDEIKGEHGNETKNILNFTGDVKPMILNRSNAEFLCSEFGDDSDHWIGKPVEVYVDPSVMFAGKRVGGVRIRRAGNTAPVIPWPWAKSVAECAKVGISEDKLKAELKAAGLTGYNPARDTPTIQTMIDSLSGAASFDSTPIDSGESIPF